MVSGEATTEEKREKDREKKGRREKYVREREREEEEILKKRLSWGVARGSSCCFDRSGPQRAPPRGLGGHRERGKRSRGLSERSTVEVRRRRSRMN